MNVETTPELILAAAEKCPQAKEALKTLFPKVFENELNHPYDKRYQVIKDDRCIYFELTVGNTDANMSVINHCIKMAGKTAEGFIWAKSMNRVAYLGHTF